MPDTPINEYTTVAELADNPEAERIMRAHGLGMLLDGPLSRIAKGASLLTLSASTSGAISRDLVHTITEELAAIDD